MNREDLLIIAKGFPRIASSIESIWNSPECDDYLNKLIIDTRGDRKGFPEDVLRALLRLSREHFDFTTLNEGTTPWIISQK